ncbi:MAG: DJ-1/PfpI family protein [Planctomycetota bacterium]|nr:DJ-1/PfpI family protein [Planctomycetota bacterium]
MAENETSDEAEVDEHGLAIQKYVSMVLVVVPEHGYAETTFRYVRSALYNVHVGTRSVSTVDQELIKGHLQDEFQVDGTVKEEDMSAYSGVIFCGGEGSLSLVDDSDAVRLAQEAAAQKKLIAAWGHSVAILAKAGVLKKKKVTGDPSIRPAIEAAGGKYTGTQVQRDGMIVTAIDDAAGLRLGRQLIRFVGI